MSRPSPTIQLSGKIVTETPKAMRFFLEMVADRDVPQDKQISIWVPLSQIPKLLRQSAHSTDQDVIHISEWIWKQKLADHWNGQDPSLSKGEDALDELDPLDELDDMDDLDPPF